MGSLSDSIKFIIASAKDLKAVPALTLPLAISCGLIIFTLFFTATSISWSQYTHSAQLVLVILALAFVSFFSSIACLLLLCLLEQMINGNKLSFAEASNKILSEVIIEAFPIALTWIFAWFTLSLMGLIFAKTKEAKHLRTYLFLIYPTIILGKKDFITALKKSRDILNSPFNQYASENAFTNVAAIICVATPLLLFFGKLIHIPFPQFIWLITFIFSGCAFCFFMYIEQMYIAKLYASHLLSEDPKD